MYIYTIIYDGANFKLVSKEKLDITICVKNILSVATDDEILKCGDPCLFVINKLREIYDLQWYKKEDKTYIQPLFRDEYKKRWEKVI